MADPGGRMGGMHPPHRHIMEFFAELRATVRQLVCSTQQTCCESMHYAACNVEHARIDSHCTSLSKSKPLSCGSAAAAAAAVTKRYHLA